MLLNVIIIGSFIGTAIFMYFMIGLFVDFLLPYKTKKKEHKNPLKKIQLKKKVKEIKLPHQKIEMPKKGISLRGIYR